MTQIELPTEVEDLIFELATINPDDPQDLPFHLLLVSRRVYSILKPLLYRTVFVTDVGPDFDDEQNYALIENLVLVDSDLKQTQRILPQCSSLKTIRTFTPLMRISHYIGTSSMRLKRLAVSPLLLEFASTDLMMAQFSELTHLDLTNGPSTGELLLINGAIGHLQHLTHLAVDDREGQQNMSMIDHILLSHQQLTIVILCRETIDPKYSYDENSLPSSATPVQMADSRLLRIVCPTGYGSAADNDWLAGLLNYRLDKWTLAEGLLEVRKLGYFKNSEDASGWIDPSSGVVVELLQSRGCDYLASSSKLWAEHLKADRENNNKVSGPQD